MSQYRERGPRQEAADERFRLGRLALKEGRVQEARDYLLKAVEIDREHSDAWLWLSATTNDPAEQRKCLEWALAANPANPEARRGLAILQGRLNPNDLLPQGAGAPPRKPASLEAPQTGLAFICRHCGGSMRFDPATTHLICERCGQVEVIEERPASEADQLLDLTLPTEQGHTWAEGQRRMSCQQCSATTIFPAGQTSGECPFCGSSVLVNAREDAGLIAPQAIIPMAFDAEAVKKKLRKWLGSGTFAPDHLSRLAQSGALRPAYIPFWVFEATVRGKWQARVAEGYGNGKQWILRTGEQVFFFSDELVPGTKQLPRDLLGKVRPFDLNYLVEFTPDYLAGWPAVTYDVPLAEASLDARERMLNKAKKEIVHKAAPGQEIRDLQINAADFGGVTYKQILVPIWLGRYQYQGRRFRVIVNGQTGKVAGDKPTDSVKVAVAVLITVVILVIFAFIAVALLAPAWGLR